MVSRFRSKGVHTFLSRSITRTRSRSACISLRYARSSWGYSFLSRPRIKTVSKSCFLSGARVVSVASVCAAVVCTAAAVGAVVSAAPAPQAVSPKRARAHRDSAAALCAPANLPIYFSALTRNATGPSPSRTTSTVPFAFTVTSSRATGTHS